MPRGVPNTKAANKPKAATKPAEQPLETQDAPAPEAAASETPAVAAAPEAPAETPAETPTPAKSKKAGAVFYKSREKESVTFDIQIRGQLIRPVWDGAHERLVWEVPAELADGFELHHHFVTGRVIRSDG